MKKIKNCFCHHGPLNLIKWVKRRYIDHIPTVELIAAAQSQEDIEAIALVGLIDVPETVLLESMSDVERHDKHILECRASALEVFNQLRVQDRSIDYNEQ